MHERQASRFNDGVPPDRVDGLLWQWHLAVDDGKSFSTLMRAKGGA